MVPEWVFRYGPKLLGSLTNMINVAPRLANSKAVRREGAMLNKAKGPISVFLQNKSQFFYEMIPLLIVLRSFA